MCCVIFFAQWTHTCTHTRTYVHTHTQTHTHTQCVHMHAHTLIQKHTRTYTHTHTHTHTHSLTHRHDRGCRATGGNLPKFIIFSVVNVKLKMLWSGGEMSALHICCTHGASPEESWKGNSQWSHSFYLICQELAVMHLFLFFLN